MQKDLWAGKTVLIVDDSDLMRLELSSIYSDLGMRVIEMAKNGVEAIQLFEKYSPDFVSLDIIMPEMHGIDCYRKLSILRPELDFIFVSCLAADSHLITAFEGKIPAARFVAKPARLEDIQRALTAIYSRTEANSVQTPSLNQSEPNAVA